MDVNFSLEEKIEILEKNGYEVKLEERNFWRSAYHNDTENYVEEVFIVYKDGKEFESCTYRNYSKDWNVIHAFNILFIEKMKKLLQLVD